MWFIWTNIVDTSYARFEVHCKAFTDSSYSILRSVMCSMYFLHMFRLSSSRLNCLLIARIIFGMHVSFRWLSDESCKTLLVNTVTVIVDVTHSATQVISFSPKLLAAKNSSHCVEALGGMVLNNFQKFRVGGSTTTNKQMFPCKSRMFRIDSH